MINIKSIQSPAKHHMNWRGQERRTLNPPYPLQFSYCEVVRMEGLRSGLYAPNAFYTDFFPSIHFKEAIMVKESKLFLMWWGVSNG